MASQILDYVLQPDAYTCQSAAICRVIGDRSVAQVRSELEALGEPGNPAVMGDYLRPRVAEYHLNMNASLRQAIQACRDGYHLITHGWFTASGHVLGLRDYDASTETFVAEDPWCEFDFAGWTYDHSASGNDCRYSARGIWAACVVGSGPGDAHALYLGDRLVGLDDQGMWLHMIKN
jgi:hypothetical protein